MYINFVDAFERVKHNLSRNTLQNIFTHGESVRGRAGEKETHVI